MSRFQRQSFLGRDSDAHLNATTIGVVGLGGGGSPMAQQFAYLGIGEQLHVDPDHITDTNTNRLIGGTARDVQNAALKIVISERVVMSIQPNACVRSIPDEWKNATEQLKRCDIIMGAVDKLIEREQLERFARRHLIPYIDIGMDVHHLGEHGHLISGQVILSSPGFPCLRCCGFITDELLEREAARYGAAGDRPQVVWPNGVLASTAVGLAVQLITPWFRNPPPFTYLEYDGNRGTVSISAHVAALSGKACPHHPKEETGDPLFDIRNHIEIEGSPPKCTPRLLIQKLFGRRLPTSVQKIFQG
jgi:molybdopterin-synthase adenylyltransferase